MQEVTATERGGREYLGVPPHVWDDIVARWNKEQFQEGRRDLVVSVEFAPLFKAIYARAYERPGSHAEHLERGAWHGECVPCLVRDITELRDQNAALKQVLDRR